MTTGILTVCFTSRKQAGMFSFIIVLVSSKYTDICRKDHLF